MPTPTSLYPSAGTRVSDGLGIVGGLLFKLMMLLAANGIGFGVWWYTQGRYGTGELDGETAALAEELAEWEERAAAEQAAAEQAAAVVDEGHRIEAMFEAANNVDWPPVVLTGMVAGSSRNRTSAILNGVLVALHQTIEGIELIEVTDDGVVLEYEQTRKYIRVGEST